jgi:hypothetical protein
MSEAQTPPYVAARFSRPLQTNSFIHPKDTSNPASISTGLLTGAGGIEAEEFALRTLASWLGVKMEVSFCTKELYEATKSPNKAVCDFLGGFVAQYIAYILATIILVSAVAYLASPKYGTVLCNP